MTSKSIPIRPKYVSKSYYSERKLGQIKKDLLYIGKHFAEIFSSFEKYGYFQEAFGIYCVDGDTEGYSERGLAGTMHFIFGTGQFWPIHSNWKKLNEDNFFDLLELLHDHVSKPLSGHLHSFGNCGYHYDQFNKQAGQLEFREEINLLISQYQTGYILSPKGEIHQLGSKQLQRLIGKDVPTSSKQDIEEKIRIAENKFLRHRSNLDDRRDAVKTLVEVLEFLRPQIKQVIAKEDESDLFNPNPSLTFSNPIF